MRPLGKGDGMVNGSLGGPLVQIGGADFPAPIVDVGGGYGVRDDLDLFLRTPTSPRRRSAICTSSPASPTTRSSARAGRCRR